MRTQAALNDASWSIQATAETSVQALEAFVAPHQTSSQRRRADRQRRLLRQGGDASVDPDEHSMRSSSCATLSEEQRNARCSDAKPGCRRAEPRSEYFGKYRGTVVDNVDPVKRGRLACPRSRGAGSTAVWAMPCVPYAGPKLGFYAMPESAPASGSNSRQAILRIRSGRAASGTRMTSSRPMPIRRSSFSETNKFTLRIDDGNGEIIIENDSGSQIKLTCAGDSAQELRREAGSFRRAEDGVIVRLPSK